MQKYGLAMTKKGKEKGIKGDCHGCKIHGLAMTKKQRQKKERRLLRFARNDKKVKTDIASVASLRSQ
jgi:hypothetical protein